MALPLAAAVAAAKASFTSSSGRGEPSADRSGISTVVPGQSIRGVPLSGSVEQTTHGRHRHAGAGFRRRRQNGRHGLARPLRGEEHRRRQQRIRAGRKQEHSRQRTNTEVSKQSCFDLVGEAASRSARCRGDCAWAMSEKASSARSKP